jgi:hypothetical protein
MRDLKECGNNSDNFIDEVLNRLVRLPQHPSYYSPFSLLRERKGPI